MKMLASLLALAAAAVGAIWLWLATYASDDGESVGVVVASTERLAGGAPKVPTSEGIKTLQREVDAARVADQESRSALAVVNTVSLGLAETVISAAEEARAADRAAAAKAKAAKEKAAKEKAEREKAEREAREREAQARVQPAPQPVQPVQPAPQPAPAPQPVQPAPQPVNPPGMCWDDDEWEECDDDEWDD
ncbi:hypothetical protein ACQBAT_13845 [Ornithinimicrobium sp. Y1847]|uniref:hypothetical protein n=1 Tax=Ornithinimicrobium sp. Y1847 TaxID=3405419 RepID=UPI003B6837C9